MSRTGHLLSLISIALFAAVLIGCDTTAERELKRAEKAINEAQQANAEEYATEDYLAAELNLNEAVELAHNNRIQESRQAAIKAKLRAEDALRKAKERQNILDAEMDELGR